MFDLAYQNFYKYNVENTKKIHHIFYDLQKPLFYNSMKNIKNDEMYLLYMLGKGKIMLIFLTQFTVYLQLSKETNLVNATSHNVLNTPPTSSL